MKPSSKTTYVTPKEWFKKLTPNQKRTIDALIRHSEEGHYARYRQPVERRSTAAVFPELPEHPLGIYAERFCKKVESKPKPVDPIVLKREGITEDGREVVNEWRGRPC